MRRKSSRAQQQLWLAKEVISGGHLFQSMDLSASGSEHSGSAQVNDLGQKFLQAVAAEDHAGPGARAPSSWKPRSCSPCRRFSSRI